MGTGLEGIAAKARKETKLKFTSLCHHVTRELIWESLGNIPKQSAPGVDGISVDEAKKTFEGWIEEMLSSIHRKAYKAPPVRRGLDPQAGEDRQAALRGSLYGGSGLAYVCLQKTFYDISLDSI